MAHVASTHAIRGSNSSLLCLASRLSVLAPQIFLENLMMRSSWCLDALLATTISVFRRLLHGEKPGDRNEKTASLAATTAK